MTDPPVHTRQLRHSAKMRRRIACLYLSFSHVGPRPRTVVPCSLAQSLRAGQRFSMPRASACLRLRVAVQRRGQLFGPPRIWMAKPACRNMTRKPVISVHTKFTANLFSLN